MPLCPDPLGRHDMPAEDLFKHGSPSLANQTKRVVKVEPLVTILGAISTDERAIMPAVSCPSAPWLLQGRRRRKDLAFDNGSARSVFSRSASAQFMLLSLFSNPARPDCAAPFSRLGFLLLLRA